MRNISHRQIWQEKNVRIKTDRKVKKGTKYQFLVGMRLLSLSHLESRPRNSRVERAVILGQVRVQIYLSVFLSGKKGTIICALQNCRSKTNICKTYVWHIFKKLPNVIFLN